MRSFTKIEKEFISFLVHSERGQRNIMSFLDKYLEKTKIRLDFKKGEGEYRFEVEEASDEVFGWIINKVEDLQEIIAVIINLIVYLKNNGYIAPYSVTPDKWSEVHEFGRGIDDDLKLNSPLPDKELVKLLIEYAFKEIVPLEPLDDLEKNKYVSQEERRFNKQLWQAWAGIIVAILIGGFGIYFNYISLQKQKESAITQNKQSKITNESLKKQISDIIEKQTIENNETQQIKMLLENIDESKNAWTKDIENKLDTINNSINKLNDNRYNKQIQPTQKPRG